MRPLPKLCGFTPADTIDDCAPILVIPQTLENLDSCE